MNKEVATNGNLSILSVSSFDIYHKPEDRARLKAIFGKLFSVGDELFFFFRREEDLTEDSELIILREKIFKRFEDDGKFQYLIKIDQRRFDAIAMIRYDETTPDFMIDLWKYFFACDFFRPTNDLTFEEFEDYLQITGVEDRNGLRQLWDKLCDFICIKGYDGERLIISYYSELELIDQI
ncbi:hypothetical protein ACSBL2_01455 [Pedobacter sp. AW31-3R]|uniref:hypothetical protein n=1 Tax=Pedobacter sp. AW31-3R TaxID=3445781 RepID=UPI003FA10A76